MPHSKLPEFQTSRTTPSQTRAAETVRKILSATSSIITESGIENVTTNAIAERLSISVGSIYKYYKTKDDILFALCDVYAWQFMRLIKQNADSHPFSPESVIEYIQRLSDDLVVFASQNPAMHFLFHNYIVKSVSDYTDTLEPQIKDALFAVISNQGIDKNSLMSKADSDAVYVYLYTHMDLYIAEQDSDTYRMVVKNTLKLVSLLFED
jgi:AcrR family transcriptional regulator